MTRRRTARNLSWRGYEARYELLRGHYHPATAAILAHERGDR